MSTGPDERLPFRDLAGQGARIVRTLAPDALPRLAAIASGRRELRIDMTFTLDADRRPWVRGTADTAISATCQRCLERFDQNMLVDFELCIVADPDLASALADGVDVLVAEDDTVTVAQVIEDELLLALPERLCREDPCPYAPVLSYPADEAPQPAPEDNPFHVLASLKRAAGESTD
ncbi:MAG: DUF177 domain-containing protein [Pseudomonadales bacterium]